MYIHYPGNSLGLRWTIYRGLSRITEDFESATLTCFLYSKDNKFPVEATVMSAADGGSYLYIELSPELQLPDGIYGVSAIWKKNEDRSIARSMREGLFSVVNNQAEATDQGGTANIPVLKFHSSAGTFGYDGLSAYELALLKGLTTKSETEWVQEQLDVATGQIFDAKDEAVGQAETAITAAKDVAVGQAETAITAAKDVAVGQAEDAIGESKEDALDAIAEAIEGLEVHYTIETDKGEVKDVQLKDGQGNKLMPRTKTEVISIDNIHNNEYQGFVVGQCWLQAGLNAVNHFSAHTDLIEVKQGDVIIVENYRIYSQATGGGPFCAIYPTAAGTGGTRYNCNDVLVPDPSVSLKYTFTVPQDGWIGINIGVETQSYIQACRITHQYIEEVNLEDKIDELDEGVKRIEDSLYQPIDGKQVDVIIFMGQSNMGGRGIVTDTHPEDAPTVIDGAGYEFRAITDPTKLYPVTKTLGVDENVSGGIDDTVPKTGGCVPAFVNAYFLATKIPVIAVSASEGNTRSSAWKAGTARLNDAISRLESCVTWLTANGYDIAHRYMVWCQGESDADAGIDAASYSTNFANMFAAMQSHGIEKCYMIQIGEYNGSTSGLAEAYQLIQQAQVDICDTTPNVVMVSDSFRLFKARGLMKDQFHYYQDGYNIVGLQAGHNAGLNRDISGDIVYDYIETNKVRLTTPLGEKILPQTDAEVVEYTDDDGNKKSGEYEFLQLDNVRKSFLNNNREYASFRQGKYYLPSGALTNSANGFYTTKIPVLDKKDLKIIFKLNLSSAACVVLFFDSSKTIIPTLNIAGGTSRNGIPSMVDLSDEIYDDVAYVAFSHYGNGEHYAFLTTESNITDVDKSNIRKYVSFPSTGYYQPSGTFTQSKRALNTGFIIIDRSYRFFTFNANLASQGALILFKDKEGNIIPALTIIGEGKTVDKTIDLSLPEYDEAFTLCVSNYDNVYGHYAYYTNSDEIGGYIANENLYGLRKPSSVPYQGPNILIFGDSITDNCAFTIVDDTTTSYIMKDKEVSYTKDGRTINYNKWPKIIKNKIRPFDIRNYALSGASYKDANREQGLERRNLSYQIKVALNDLSNPNNVFPTVGNYEPDIVILALGTNDQVPNDTPADAFAKTIFSDGWVDIDATLENLDRTKFCEAARFAFLSLKRAFPKALFLCVLPAQKGSTNRNNELNAALKEMAEYHSIRIIDASKEFGILCDFEKSGAVGTYLKDGLHPNDLGQNMYARAIMSFINTYYVDMGAQFDSTY